MKAYKHLVKNVLANGHVVSVFDGEEWPVRKSSTYKNIIDAIESVEEAWIKIYDVVTVDGELSFKCLGSAIIVPFGLEDDETVVDHTDNEYMALATAA